MAWLVPARRESLQSVKVSFVRADHPQFCTLISVDDGDSCYFTLFPYSGGVLTTHGLGRGPQWRSKFTYFSPGWTRDVKGQLSLPQCLHSVGHTGYATNIYWMDTRMDG